MDSWAKIWCAVALVAGVIGGFLPFAAISTFALVAVAVFFVLIGVLIVTDAYDAWIYLVMGGLTVGVAILGVLGGQLVHHLKWVS